MAGQHSAKWKPLLRGQPHHRAVGPHRSALLLQVSWLSPHAPPPHPSPAQPASLPTRGADNADKTTPPTPTQPRKTPSFSTSDSADPLQCGALRLTTYGGRVRSALSELSLPELPLGPTSGPASSSNPCFPALAPPQPSWEGSTLLLLVSPVRCFARPGACPCRCWQAPPMPWPSSPSPSHTSNIRHSLSG